MLPMSRDILPTERQLQGAAGSQRLKHDLAISSVAHGDDDRIREILETVCRVTEMGFAAVARVTDERWIACQVVDKMGFGLRPGGELKLQETICNEIRQCGDAIFIDHVFNDPRWNSHPVPAQYGFQSYVSIPVHLADGSFYGTLCAIDPRPRQLSEEATVALLTSYAKEVALLISAKVLKVP
jgi:GAF domain-containing protein